MSGPEQQNGPVARAALMSRLGARHAHHAEREAAVMVDVAGLLSAGADRPEMARQVYERLTGAAVELLGALTVLHGAPVPAATDGAVEKHIATVLQLVGAAELICAVLHAGDDEKGRARTGESS